MKISTLSLSLSLKNLKIKSLSVTNFKIEKFGKFCDGDDQMTNVCDFDRFFYTHPTSSFVVMLCRLCVKILDLS